MVRVHSFLPPVTTRTINGSSCLFIFNPNNWSIKCESHENATLYSLENLIVHDLVHFITKPFISIKYKEVKLWLREALAASLANQHHNIRFNQSIDNLYTDDFVDYGAFHAIGNYLLNKTSKEYIYKLLNDKQFLENEIPNIYNVTKEHLYQANLKNF